MKRHWARGWAVWGRRLLLGALLSALVLLIALGASSYLYEFPASLSEKPPAGQRIFDRNGQLLARKTTLDGVFASPLRLSEAGPTLTMAIVAAEDKRFWAHPGIDALAILRAAAQALYHRHPVSGASTITQQLARNTFSRPRSFAGKWHEMALALKIERQLTKSQILEHYLNRVHFGARIVGARAAADHYFGKPPAALDLAEAATLAGLVRGPSLFDPRRHPELAQKQRDRVLARLVSTGKIPPRQAQLARSLPLSLHPRPPLPGAQHWVRAIAGLSQEPDVHTTLHGTLQRDVEALVAERRRSLQAHHSATTAAAVVVLDNRSGEVLAYVGSPDFSNQKDQGENDGVLALRQPGSALKPFIYAQAIDQLGYTPVTLLPDEPKHFRTAQGFYSPRNFDRKFRGEVELSRALANSLNVPAVYVLEKLGEQNVLTILRELGFGTLDQSASHYGPALALGDGEVSLLKLANAYATLARGGMSLSPRFLLNSEAGPSVRIYSPTASAIISEILSNEEARREAFGSSNALELPFVVAAKTGTSKGYRDTWTVGYTRNFTIAVGPEISTPALPIV